WLCVVSLRVLWPATARRNDFGAVEKIVRNSNRLIEYTTSIITQIDNVTLQSPTDLFPESFHSGDNTVVCFLVKGRDTDVTDISFAVIFHRLDLDGCADQCNLEGFLAAGPEHCEVHFRTRGPSQKILHLVETQSLQALAVDGENAVPGFDSRARGRGIIDRRYDV